MRILPSDDIIKNYNGISDFCKETSEPVYLTVKGKGDLVVMDIGAFEYREKCLKIREDLIAAEEDRRRGFKGHTIDETYEMMMKTIEEHG